MQPELHIDLFGDFRILSGDELLAVVPQARQQALLVYLLLHRSAPQSRSHVAFLLWPDSSEGQALSNLRKMLTHLRQTAPVLAQALYADYKVIQWRPTVPFTLDVADFEAQLAQANAAEQAGDQRETLACLAAAVELYAGPLVPSCYDDWILAERERCQQSCLSALQRLIILYESQGDLATATRYAQQLLRLDPLQERIYLQLMRLQALQGDRAGALRTYHTCVTILERELDVAPGAEIQDAYARLLKLAPPTIDSSTLARRLHPASAPRLVGRQAEWAQIQSAWRLATQHRAHFVCILGEAGIGKTYLAEEMLAWASQQGFAVARTRSYAGEGQLAYAPVVEWLRAEPIRAVRQRVAKTWRSEVARLAPEIITEQPDIPVPTPMTDRWQRQQLWEALARTLLAAPQPLLLLIDDLQWCDQETLEWLRYLLHFDTRSCLLVMGTARPEEIDDDHSLSTLLRHLRSAEQLTELELGSLDAEQTATLAARITPQPLTSELQQALYRVTGGNPLFVVETVRAGLSEGAEEQAKILPVFPTPLPPKVQAVIQSRLAQLSPSARNLARLAAVIGRAFSFELLVQASGMDEDPLAQALDELWRRRIVREQGTYTYDFSHDRIRDVAYAELSPVRRRQTHRQIAVALEEYHGAELDMVSGDLAAHYEQAGLIAPAIRFYQMAGRVAQARYAYSEAVLYLQRGLTLLRSLPALSQAKEQELDLLITLGAILSEVKGLAAPEVGEIYGQAFTLCQLIGNQGQLYIIQAGLGVYYGNRGEWKVAHKLAKDNLALAQVLHDPVKVQRAHHGLGLVSLAIGMFPQALDNFEQAIRMITFHRMRSDQSEIELPSRLSLAQSALCLWLLGYPDQAYQRIQDASTLNQLDQPPPAIAVNLYFSLVLCHLLRDWHTMLQLAEEMRAVATKYTLVLFEADASVHAGFARACQGETALGIAQMRQGLEYYKAVEERMFVPYALAYLVEIYALGGQIDAALEALNEAITMTEQTGEYFWYAELLRLRGETLLASGAAAQDVERWYQHARQVARQQQAKSLELRAATSLARLWQQQARSTEAYQLLAEIYSWFTEGFDTADLKTAKMLLSDLQAMR